MLAATSLPSATLPTSVARGGTGDSPTETPIAANAFCSAFLTSGTPPRDVFFVFAISACAFSLLDERSGGPVSDTRKMERGVARGIVFDGVGGRVVGELGRWWGSGGRNARPNRLSGVDRVEALG